ncbi:MAG: hypothetical protein ACLRM9_01660 [Collinsella aerofaciens]
MLRIDGIGAKAIEEPVTAWRPRPALHPREQRRRCRRGRPSQLLQMVLAPTVRTISCWVPPPTHHADADEELLGALIDDKKAPANGVINEDMASLDELLNQLVDTDDAEEAKDNDEE